MDAWVLLVSQHNQTGESKATVRPGLKINDVDDAQGTNST